MSTPVQTRLDDEELRALDAAIASGRFASRSDALRAGLAGLLREEREREIAAAYARGYGRKPQEAWVGELGLSLLDRVTKAERTKGKDRL
jgi:Arc/MetJ-type ribon-helix-helix transcriptional regulator